MQVEANKSHREDPSHGFPGQRALDEKGICFSLTALKGV